MLCGGQNKQAINTWHLWQETVKFMVLSHAMPIKTQQKQRCNSVQLLHHSDYSCSTVKLCWHTSNQIQHTCRWYSGGRQTSNQMNMHIDSTVNTGTQAIRYGMHRWYSEQWHTIRWHAYIRHSECWHTSYQMWHAYRWHSECWHASNKMWHAYR